jgi:hypothetical protein
LNIVVVHGVPSPNPIVCGSFFTILGRGGLIGVRIGPDVAVLLGTAAVVVTVEIMYSVLHPVWQVEHGPDTMVVPVVGQHASSGGTYVVVVASKTQSGAAEHL